MNEYQTPTEKCPYCEKIIKSGDNFCVYCGEPISELAKIFETRRIKNAQLKLLISMTESITDKKTLAILNVYFSKLKA